MKETQLFWLLVTVAVGLVLAFLSASPLSGIVAGGNPGNRLPSSRKCAWFSKFRKRFGSVPMGWHWAFMEFGYSGAEPLNIRVFPFW
jgi:hypothetical protein